MRGDETVTQFLGDINTGNMTLQDGGVTKTGKIKWDLESGGTQTRAGLRWQAVNSTVQDMSLLL
jgi:hypothetical protein